MNLINCRRCCFLLLTLLLAASCSSHYQLTESVRADYAINSSLIPDSSIIKTYLPYKSQLDAEMTKIIGHSALLMSKKSSDTLPESLLSNFFADAVLEEAKKLDTAIDFAMPSTKGGIRVDLPKGPIRVSNIFELMPFENELVICTIKGTEAQRLFEFVAASNGQPVAGLQIKIKDKKPMEVLIGGKALELKRNYRVLTSDYVSNGGDNTLGFKNPLEKKVLGLKVRDALINYVKYKHAEGKMITAQLDGRITY